MLERWEIVLEHGFSEFSGGVLLDEIQYFQWTTYIFLDLNKKAEIGKTGWQQYEL